MRHLLASFCLGIGLLAGCGGGGAPAGAPPAPVPVLGAGEVARDDPTVYSSAPSAALSGAEEAAAITKHQLSLAGRSLDYTATAGHLIARAPGTLAAQASVFYVAYTLDGADSATRPVTFFYNGGPGSASVWLHLGSFGPKRLVTGIPATTAARPFPLVDNPDSLLGVSDLVFVNAVGSGRSQAIAPFVNQSFWGVDADAALFRDFITRYLQFYARTASPKFLYGESYGGPRSAVLARLLQDAGVMLDGVVLQSPALDYNNNCGVSAGAAVSCAGYLPSYAAVGAWHALSNPVPTDLDAWLDAARDMAATRYGPAVELWRSSGTTAPQLWQALADLTGLGVSQWSSRFDMDSTTYRSRLLPGRLIGRYDGRMHAANGSALAAEGDPSSTWLTSSFVTAIDGYLRDTLYYRNGSTYVVFSNAIEHWDFSHAGRALPDTVPDLQAALAKNPALRVLSVSGVHDLATPFHVTEQDLTRLNSPRVLVRNYPGGHMSFLDDSTRPRQRADMEAFFAATPAPSTVQAVRRAPLALPARVRPDRAGVIPVAPAIQPRPEPAVQAPMCDPCVPQRPRP